jgi:hypothetical protein
LRHLNCLHIGERILVVCNFDDASVVAVIDEEDKPVGRNLQLLLHIHFYLIYKST